MASNQRRGARPCYVAACQLLLIGSPSDTPMLMQHGPRHARRLLADGIRGTEAELTAARALLRETTLLSERQDRELDQLRAARTEEQQRHDSRQIDWQRKYDLAGLALRERSNELAAAQAKLVEREHELQRRHREVSELRAARDAGDAALASRELDWQRTSDLMKLELRAVEGEYTAILAKLRESSHAFERRDREVEQLRLATAAERDALESRESEWKRKHGLLKLELRAAEREHSATLSRLYDQGRELGQRERDVEQLRAQNASLREQLQSREMEWQRKEASWTQRLEERTVEWQQRQAVLTEALAMRSAQAREVARRLGALEEHHHQQLQGVSWAVAEELQATRSWTTRTWDCASPG